MKFSRKRRARYVPIAAARAASLGIFFDSGDWDQIWLLLADQVEPTHVYAIVDLASKLVKFGRSVRPAQRLRTLQTGCGNALGLWGFCQECSGFNEASVHAELGDHRANGEWFHLNLTTQAMIDKIRGRANALNNSR